jgi:hypothetical protein
LAAGLIVLGFSARDASAGQVPLPTTLDALLVPGATVVTGHEPDTYSKFSYSSDQTTLAPDAAHVNVSAFGPVGSPIEDGITFKGAFQAAAMGEVDYQIDYIVTAPKGFKLTDAFASFTANIPQGSTGTVSIGETFTDIATGNIIGNIQLDANHLSQIVNFAGVQSILVQKDILINGGSLGAGVSFVNQGFSSQGVPEPASWALLGIGMTGFLAFRRFFKKTSVA